MSMNIPIVIDHVVRQTTVLIAQLATTGGTRAPLAQVADQVFRELTGALEAQGVRRKVVADMFGLALRSYQAKVRRLDATAEDSTVSLWEAVYDYMQREQTVTRTQLLRRFGRDDSASVLGIAHDMVESGLLYRTGRGDSAVFRATQREDLIRAASTEDREVRSAIVWALVYTHGPVTLQDLSQHIRIPAQELQQAIDDAVASGRVEARGEEESATYASASLVLPPGDPQGWEASLVDHYQSVVAAVCVKVRNGQTRALPDDQVGGSTFHFDVWPGHPHETEVRSLLADHRQRMVALWERVHAHNASTKPTDFERVTFYFGQYATSQNSSAAHGSESEA